MTPDIAIIGAGGWGTALAITLGRAGRNVRLWAFEPYLVETILATRENPLYLPGARIPATVTVTNSAAESLSGAGIVIVAVPSHFLRSIVEQMIPHLKPEMMFVTAAKGIENGTLMRMSEVLTDTIRPVFQPRVAA